MENESSPFFFETQAELHHWFQQQHRQLDVAWIGFYKKATGLPSITLTEAIDEALCFGWVEGRTQRMDEKSYRIRFTPRRTGSIWSRKNIDRFSQLRALGLVSPAGETTFTQRNEEKSGLYPHERASATLSPEFALRFQEDEKAWAYFTETLAPSYRKTSIYWVMRAKRSTTQERRLKILIESSAQGRKIPPLQ